jgi:hypothetical protein
LPEQATSRAAAIRAQLNSIFFMVKGVFVSKVRENVPKVCGCCYAIRARQLVRIAPQIRLTGYAFFRKIFDGWRGFAGYFGG